MRTIHTTIALLIILVISGFRHPAETDFEKFINYFEQLDLPSTIPSESINGNAILPELTQKFIDANYPIKGDRGKGFKTVSAYGLVKKTDIYYAVIIHKTDHTAERYYLTTYSPTGKRISQVIVAKFPASLTTARMLTATISAEGTVNTTGTDEILIKGEGYKDVEMDITYVIMDDGTITTDESTDPESGALGDNGCDEKEVEKINEIKFTIAHNLINAKTLNATTDDGTELTTFYVEGDLVKLTAEAKGFMQEIYVSNGYPVCFEVTDFGSGSAVTDHYYFKNNKLVCRENPIKGLKTGPPDEPETDLIAGFEYYLNAIQ
jgi:hypothetical protein